ncbi:MAG: hypothetical protein ACE5J1_01660 [Nitrospiria bacterium]
MSSSMEQSLTDVMKAMEDLNHRFEKEIEALRRKGMDEDALQTLVKGALAMKDAGGIYLTWSRHFVDRLDEPGGLDQTE